MIAREPCQVRNEAALNGVSYVPLVTWLFFEYGIKIAHIIEKLRMNI
jgi:hypothetical protein